MEWHDPPAEELPDWQSAAAAAFRGERPILCPSRDGAQLRYFFNRHSEERGSFWIWCPRCRAYEHGSGPVPGWWRDIPVPVDELRHDPDWLDKNWDDGWLVLQPQSS